MSLFRFASSRQWLQRLQLRSARSPKHLSRQPPPPQSPQRKRTVGRAISRWLWVLLLYVPPWHCPIEVFWYYISSPNVIGPNDSSPKTVDQCLLKGIVGKWHNWPMRQFTHFTGHWKWCYDWVRNPIVWGFNPMVPSYSMSVWFVMNFKRH